MYQYDKEKCLGIFTCDKCKVKKIIIEDSLVFAKRKFINYKGMNYRKGLEGFSRFGWIMRINKDNPNEWEYICHKC